MFHGTPCSVPSSAFVVVLSFVVSIGVVLAPTANAHRFTRTDGNDSPGRLDIRSASVSHAGRTIVHSVRTFERWKAGALNSADSFLVIWIDTNFDNDFERCAFIYHRGRLRGSMSNCRRTFIRSLRVSKPTATSAAVRIPRGELPGAYRWVAVSFWTGAPARCSSTCFDAAPNRPPPILHDLTPPTVSMSTADLLAWEDGTNTFPFPFSVSDTGAGVGTWTVQRRAIGSTTFVNVVQGSGGGNKSPQVSIAPGRYQFRVVAKDRHGNQDVGPLRRVYVARDDDELAPEGVFSAPPTPTPDATAWGGSYAVLDASSGAVTFTYDWTPPPTDCLFALIGPGSGTWDITITPDSGSPQNLTNADFPDDPRQTIYEDTSCSTTYTVTVNSGAFGLDAVLG
jgi:hypothetical protein